MAKIVHSEVAPSEAVKYDLAGTKFELGNGEDSFETTDPTVLSNARQHPWLAIEVDPEAETSYELVSTQVAPEDDALSAHNSKAFDPDEIAKVEEAKSGAVRPLAVNAALPQDEAIKVESPTPAPDVAVTLAADDRRDDVEVGRRAKTDKETS
jgi:hypothetical protein